MPFAEAPGARLYYETTGTGTPIVFVHETATDLRSWESQVRWFSRSHECIAFDVRGYGKSEAGQDPRRHDLRRLSEDIGSVMDAAGVRSAFVVGHSMGAAFAAHFALHHAERCLGIALAGIGTGSEDKAAFKALCLECARALRRDGMEAIVQAMSFGPNRIQLLNKDPRGWAEFVAHLRGHDPQGVANVFEYCHSERPTVYELEAQFQALKVPTLIMVGDEDGPCLEPSMFLKRTISTAGLWICPRTGHGINLEEPALFNQTLQSFLFAVQNRAWGERDLTSAGNAAAPSTHRA
jgi:pimeloyl-ACP methyl ester carboxylesterase